MSNRIPSLDGLRAIAITLVVVAHATHRLFPWASPRAKSYVMLLAYTGVKVFFVLSGFLITGLLLRELRRSGTVSLRNFYLRRTLRIFPAMYVFLTALWIGYQAGLVKIGTDSPARILAGFAYLSDYIPVWGWPIHHTWSLSVEEQFYLLWPATLLLCGLRRASWLPLLLLVIAPICRTISYGEYRFDTVADSLAVGCLVAIHQKKIETVIRRIWPHSIPFAALLVLLVFLLILANPYSRHPVLAYLVGIPLLNATIGITTLAAIMQPPRILNRAPMIGLGKLSYSLYLWHLPWVMDPRLNWIWPAPALACAWVSYRFVETPIMEWRDRKISGTAVSRAAASRAAETHLPCTAAELQPRDGS